MTETPGSLPGPTPDEGGTGAGGPDHDTRSDDEPGHDPEMGIRFPEIQVDLIGGDGNAFAILGAVKKALKRHGVSADEQAEFMTEATSGDYDHLLATAMAWVDVN